MWLHKHASCTHYDFYQQAASVTVISWREVSHRLNVKHVSVALFIFCEDCSDIHTLHPLLYKANLPQTTEALPGKWQ